MILGLVLLVQWFGTTIKSYKLSCTLRQCKTKPHNQNLDSATYIMSQEAALTKLRLLTCIKFVSMCITVLRWKCIAHYYTINCSMATWSVVHTVQLNLNFTHTCRHICVLTCLMCEKRCKKLACASTVACNCGMYTYVSQWTHATYKRCMLEARTWFTTLHVWYSYRYSSCRQ